jgi:hypothetical protein
MRTGKLQKPRRAVTDEERGAERPASPAAHATAVRPSLADESHAIRGRVHAVIGVRGSFLSSDSVESMAEERTCRVDVTNLHAVA